MHHMQMTMVEDCTEAKHDADIIQWDASLSSNSEDPLLELILET